MEDTIQVCSGCGKMPRPIDRMEGYFICSRCGSRDTMHVKSDDYELVVTDLDAKFHQGVMKQKAVEASKEPIHAPKKKSKKSAPRPKKTSKKTVKKPVKKTKKQAPGKKKTTKKTTKKTAKKTVKKKAAKKRKR
jgi:RNA polymerase primary sigma factor